MSDKVNPHLTRRQAEAVLAAIDRALDWGTGRDDLDALDSARRRIGVAINKHTRRNATT